MKKVLFIVIVSLGLTFQGFTQNNSQYIDYKGEFVRSLKFGLGWSWTETDQKPFYVADGFSGWTGKWLPTTIHVDKRFDPAFRLQLGIQSTKYKARLIDELTDEIYYDDKSNYLGVDLNFIYNFRAFKEYVFLKNTWTLKNLHKERFYFDGYFVGGLGYNTITVPTINAGLGTDFWITYQWGLNFQSIAKWEIAGDNLFHMTHQLGVVFRLDEPDITALKAIRKGKRRDSFPFK